MPQVIWTRNFLEGQGYWVEDNVVLQDNKSAILLENNGKRSSGKRTRHINIRYYFVTDRIAAGELSVEYCPTGEMLADFFTKPLQGALFRKFRNRILNLTEEEVRAYKKKANEKTVRFADEENPNGSDASPSDGPAHHRSVLGLKDRRNGNGNRESSRESGEGQTQGTGTAGCKIVRR
jgi:hypothetical protein